MALLGKLQGLGLTQVGNDSSGNPLYLADADEDTSGLYEVSTDAYGNAIYSTVASSNVAAPAVSSGFNWDSLFKIGQAAIGLEQSQQVIDINRQRLAQGLPPLSVQQTAALRPGISVGVAPDTQQLLIWGGLAVMVLLLFNKSRS